MSELKPCPFCGCEKIVIAQKCKNGMSIKCSDCLIGINQKTFRFSIEWLRGKLIEKWNLRTRDSIGQASQQ